MEYLKATLWCVCGMFVGGLIGMRENVRCEHENFLVYVVQSKTPIKPIIRITIEQGQTPDTVYIYQKQ